MYKNLENTMYAVFGKHYIFWQKQRNPKAITNSKRPGIRVINLTQIAPSSNSQSVYQILKTKWQVKIISQNI
jgi:hypothetical protein